jgi:cell division protein FtsI (penicillin-binding protein 3)
MTVRAPARRTRGQAKANRPLLRRPGDPRGRSLTLLIVFSLLFGAIVVRLGYVQVVGAERYVAYGEEQRIDPIALPAGRGTIFDREGNDLALSVPAKSIGADPSVLAAPSAAASQLSRTLGLDVKETLAKLTGEGHFVYLARQVDEDVASKVEKLNIPGVLVFDESRRLAPAGDLARSLLGSVDIDNVGVSGLELRYDDALAGTPGEYVIERDLAGRTIPAGRHLIDPPEPGDDLVLTIDRGLQFETENIMAAQVRAVGAKSGWAIVSDPETGEILALANIEADPKTGGVGNTGNDLAVTSMYEPGSVNKVITMAAALEEGIVAPDTVLDVPDALRVADHTYTDSHSLPPRLTATDILAESSNIGTIKIAQELGMERLDDYLRRFGFGRQTALGLPHEEEGAMVDPENWSGTSIGSIPIGQGISVTAMQMLFAYNTIANDGVYVPPTLLRATFDADGERHDVPPGEGRRVVSPTTAAQVRDMLAQVVSTGTGQAAAIDGYEVAGKTGTARKPQKGGGYRDAQGKFHHVATFAGFIPADDPQLSIIVVIDEPTTSVYAAQVAAPAFAQIGLHALRTLRIPPPALVEAGAATSTIPPLEGPRVRAHPAPAPTTSTSSTTSTTAATATTAPSSTTVPAGTPPAGGG